jgi:glycosyltransferase involved in cell wall biosynthesis
VLQQLDVQAIEVHSLVGWPSDMFEALPRLARQLGASLKVVLHDYAPLCPQINLMNGADVYCGERGEKQCRSCLKSKSGPPALIHGPAPFEGGIEIQRWRAAYHRLLSAASEISAPSNDAVRRYRRYFPDLQIKVAPHQEELKAPPRPLAMPYTGRGNLRVILIGAIGPHKGSRVLKVCAEDALARRLPLEFIVVGYTNKDPELLELSNVRITGRYDEEDLFGLLEKQQGHVAFLPSVWPETFSYTLTAAIAAGFPTVIFDLGAPAERLAEVENALVLPLELAARPKELNDRLLTFARDRAMAWPEDGHRRASSSACAPSQGA